MSGLEKYIPKLSPDTITSIVMSQEICRIVSMNQINTEALLFGLLFDNQFSASPTAKILANVGLDWKVVKPLIEQMHSESENVELDIPLSSNCKRVFELSEKLADQHTDGKINSVCLLSALLTLEKSGAMTVLNSLGISQKTLLDSINEHF